MNGEGPPRVETVGKAPLDGVIVCGMGPLALRRHLEPAKSNNQLVQGVGRGLVMEEDNPVAKNIYTTLNAVAAKLLVVGGMTERVILSGYDSAKNNPHSHPIEQALTEASLLAATYDRTQPQHIRPEQRQIADQKTRILDTKASSTTFNILEGINFLDKEAGGYWEGNLAIMSSEWHIPRLWETIKAFGLDKRGVTVLSTERVLRHYGYNPDYQKIYANLDKTQPEIGRIYEDLIPFAPHEEITYKGQSIQMENLRNNPYYVSARLASIVSPRRFWEIATSFKRYYQERDIAVPDIYNKLPDSFDEHFDFSTFKKAFQASEMRPVTKEYSAPETTQSYRILAKTVGEVTDSFFATHNPKGSIQ
ncbi:hypothetical protein HYW55_00700 [Candidatus Gottesmanbacteria bacterium]|nr:hypothetical protein [Candidatus Gottesmanbacteria bacterium]